MSTLLAQPMKIGTMELKNRMVMAPMGTAIGNMDANMVEYFVERAKGGASMIFCNIKGSDSFESTEHSIFFCPETETLFRQVVERSRLRLQGGRTNHARRRPHRRTQYKVPGAHLRLCRALAAHDKAHVPRADRRRNSSD